MKKLVLVLSLALLVGVAVKVNAQTADATIQSSTAVSISTPLTLGAQSTDVIVLQQLLITKGYLKVATPTGFYGNMTAQAVSALQARI